LLECDMAGLIPRIRRVIRLDALGLWFSNRCRSSLPLALGPQFAHIAGLRETA
jgi:hypothetical protein